MATTETSAVLEQLRQALEARHGIQYPVACLVEAAAMYRSTSSDEARCADAAIAVAQEHLDPDAGLRFILVEVRTVYGNEMIYPACDKAAAFCSIAGTRTLPRHLLKHITALGFEVRVAPAITLLATPVPA
jgi:hypothetical protein